METTVIVYIVLAFVVGIILGAACRYNIQIGKNIKDGVPARRCNEHNAYLCTRDLDYFIRNHFDKPVQLDWFKEHGFTLDQYRGQDIGNRYKAIDMEKFILTVSRLGLDIEVEQR